jgi:hypothetical protein
MHLNGNYNSVLQKYGKEMKEEFLITIKIAHNREIIML